MVGMLTPATRGAMRACSTKDLMDMVKFLFKEGAYTAEKQASMLLWQMVTVGRGDEARSQRFNEVNPPMYRRTTGEPLSIAGRRGMDCWAARHGLLGSDTHQTACGPTTVPT